METIQTIIMTSDSFQKYAVHFGDWNELDLMLNEWLCIPVFTAIGRFFPASQRTISLTPYLVSFAVQMMYAYRIYVLSGLKALVAAIIVVSVPAAMGP